MTKAEIGVATRQAEKCPELLAPPEAREKQRKPLPETLGRAWHCQHLILDFYLQSCKRTHFFYNVFKTTHCFKPLILCHFWQQPQDTNILSISISFILLLWWLSSKECLPSRKCMFSPWSGKIPWRRKWQASILAWEVPWTEECGGLRSMMSQRVGQDLATKQQPNENNKLPQTSGLTEHKFIISALGVRSTKDQQDCFFRSL